MESDFRKSPELLAVIVVGTDTLIEALPASPIQLAHACGELGYDLVVPLSWGDELVAEAALRTLENAAPTQAVFCSCPLVRERLLQPGNDLASVMLSLEAPPVAVARHLRATMGQRLGSLTFVGGCPGATSAEYDVTYEPSTFLDILADRAIKLELLPDTFVDRLPPDRRRHASLPGGCPFPELLWQRCNEMVLREADGPELALEIAQHLLLAQPALVDLASAVGCRCCGVTRSTTGTSARVAASSLEPPRATTPLFSTSVIPDLTLDVVDSSNSYQEGRYGSSETRARAPMAVTPNTALGARK